MPGMTALTVATVAVAIVLILLVRTVARSASALERQILALREQTAAKSAELRDALADMLRLVQQTEQDRLAATAAAASQAGQFVEQMNLRLADVSLDIRNQAIDVRELIRAHSSAGRKDFEGRFSELTKALDTRPALAQILDSVHELSSQVTESQVRADRLSGEVSDGSARLTVLSEQVGGMAAMLSEVPSQVRELSSQVTESQARADRLSGEVSGGSARLTVLSEQVGGMAAMLSEVPSQVRELSSQVTESQARADRLSGEVSGGSARLTALSEQVGGIADAFPSQVSALIHPLSGRITELSGKTQVLADMVGSVLRKPPRDLPIDVTVLERYTEAEMIALAETLATLRPLVPYPRWHFDADWANPDLAFQLRQWLWQYFNSRQAEGAVVVGWHHGTRLRLYLGNDLSRQIYIAGSIDPNEFAFLDRFLQPGMTFLDVGANEGIYSVFAASRVGAEGTVWAFEPSRRELDRLRCNLEINNLKVRVFPLALADCSGHGELRVAGYEHEGQNTLGAFVYAGVEVARTEPIDLMRLDDVVEQNPPVRLDVIKVDVEGAELRLFRGARATLGRYRPVLLFEASDAALRQQGASCEELLDHLRAQQYDLYEFDRNSGLPAPATLAAYSANMIAVPAGQSLPEAVYGSWPGGLKPARRARSPQPVLRRKTGKVGGFLPSPRSK
jgi:FkbM family methyltransferase